MTSFVESSQTRNHRPRRDDIRIDMPTELCPVRLVGFRRYDPGLIQRPHSHEYGSVTVVLRGMLRERVKRNDMIAGPLAVVVKPAGVIHGDEFGPDPVITCQLQLDARVHDSGSPWSGVISRWQWITGGPVVRAALALVRELRTLEDEGAIADSCVDVLAALMPYRSQRLPPAWLQTAIDLLFEELASGVTRARVAAVARVCGVHPVHLSRVFVQHHGCTISTWFRRQRVRRSSQALAAGRDRVSAIAHDHDFADHPHFNRSFRAETGMLPSEFRELVRAL